jgi:hypothetical protein
VAIRPLREIRSAETVAGATQSIGAWIHEYNEARDLLAGGRILEAQRLTVDLAAISHSGESFAHDLALLRGQILLALGRNAEAAQILMKEGAAAPDAAQLRHGLTQVEARLSAGDVAGAREVWSRWRPVAEGSLSAADAVAVLRVQSLLAGAAGDLPAARELLRHAASMAVDADGKPTPELRVIEVLQAEDVLALGTRPEPSLLADAVLRQATAEAVDAHSSAWIGEGLVLRSRCRQARGELDAMRASARAALPHLQGNLGPAHPLTQLAQTLAPSTHSAGTAGR